MSKTACLDPHVVAEVLQRLLGNDWRQRPRAARTISRTALTMAYELLVAIMLPDWEPFEQAALSVEQQAYMRSFGFDPNAEIVFINNLYQVNARVYQPNEPTASVMLHLSIKAHGKWALHDWRHLQRIKNEIPALINPDWNGRELDAIERYPPESMRVDTANQTHLWLICDPHFRWPVGWSTRLVAEADDRTNATQRPFADDERPADLTDLSTQAAMQALAVSLRAQQEPQ